MRSIVRLSRQVLTSLALTGMLVLVAVVGCTAALGLSTDGTLAAAPPPTPTLATTTPAPTATPTSPRTSAPPTKPRTTTRTTKPKPPAATGVGTWSLASGGTGVIGSGSKRLIAYRVEVEQATKVTTASFASMVDQTLADARGWTNEGWRFQRVTRPADQVGMVVRLAIPATVDRICGSLNTGGVVSCRTGKYVMINLTRWKNGVSAYRGDVVGYRQLVINHEVGHLLGHGHVGCPGPGRPEPVMMQVYYAGLQGCTKNPWPYAADGTRIG